jgi:type VI secretion system secreted protein Hcp
MTKLTICALTAAAMTVPGQAVAANFLKIGDVKSRSAAGGGGGAQIEILSWSWGATIAGAEGGSSAAKFGAVSGAHRNDSLARAVEAPIAAPLDRGSVRVKVKFPWLACRVGAAFPDAVLQNDAGRYELKDVVITSCAVSGSGGGGDRPMESLSLNYAKIQWVTVPAPDPKAKKVRVRGWDPEKKEE